MVISEKVHSGGHYLKMNHMKCVLLLPLLLLLLCTNYMYKEKAKVLEKYVFIAFRYFPQDEYCKVCMARLKSVYNGEWYTCDLCLDGYTLYKFYKRYTLFWMKTGQVFVSKLHYRVVSSYANWHTKVTHIKINIYEKFIYLCVLLIHSQNHSL